MEQTDHINQEKPMKPRWFTFKKRSIQTTLLLSICIWLLLQLTTNSHPYKNPSQHRLQDSGKSSRKLLSRRWIWEDEGNEVWDIVAHEDERLLLRKEDGGGVGDDEFDGDNEEDVERMVKLAQQATIDHVSSTARELDDGNGNVQRQRDGDTTTSSSYEVIDSELQEFFEVENNNNNN